MRKFVVVMLAALVALGFLFTPSASHAVEAKLGIYMMGDWWQPAFINFERENAGKLASSNVKNSSEGSFMFGPMFWVQLTGSWSLGGQVLFGLCMNEFSYSTWAAELTLPMQPTFAYYDVGKSECRRYDTDLTAEYAFHKYFNLLIGLRFNYDDGEQGDSLRFNTWGNPSDVKHEEYSAWYFGPSLGVGFHYDFVKDLTFSFGLSALIQFGEYNIEKKYLSTAFMLPYDYTAGYFCIGLDMNLKLAYYIAPAHLEVFVGGRYIMLPHFAAGDESSGYDLSYQPGWIDGQIEHWGGITFGFAFKF